MEVVIWSGAGISMAGLAGLVLCIVKVWRARKAGLGDAEMRAVLQGVVPLNSAALFLSFIGLMTVVIGILLA